MLEDLGTPEEYLSPRREALGEEIRLDKAS
jgi:hypothetical protein